ncbi:hypothetical protein IQ254_24390 [Nodosilinea sp. LEGE 07088]|uniref:response regulator n=1 Tax=Nodosilinea sp. LEGE 07088 TaxID=2777968 RepID=UPI001881ABC7|nr:response regulator [Nodosilinea sp. LEGE 07088]MBE9140298.1 hypothetical protein [Nodosilinea sp. LEGE 07088]
MPSQRLLCVLLIEYVDDIRAILRFSLETLSGWQVITATPDQDWLALAQQESPDVILLDDQSNSSEILAQLKADAQTHDIPALCLVARDRLTDQLQLQRDGAAVVVAKPFDPIVLVATISALVESHVQDTNS